MSDLVGLQMQFFLASILSGVVLLVVYDIIRIFRRIIKHSGFLVALEDIIFWVVGGLFIFVMMYKQNDGIIRGFSILGMLIGMLFYNHLLSKYVVNGISKLINGMIHLIYKVIHLLLTPVRFVLKKIKRLFRFLFRKVRYICKKVLKMVVKRLKKIIKTVKISVKKK